MSNIHQYNQSIDNAINKVNQAKNCLKRKEYENAENSIVDNIQYIIYALSYINGRACECDNTNAIPIVNIIGIYGAPAGTANLQQGNKYLTNNGAVITWIGNIIDVCEPGIPPDIWSVNGVPFIIKDVTGKVQQIPTSNAMIFLEEGAPLLVGTNEIGDITKARYINPTEHLSPLTNLEGYPTKQTEMYANDANKSKIMQGTVYDVYGI